MNWNVYKKWIKRLKKTSTYGDNYFIYPPVSNFSHASYMKIWLSSTNLKQILKGQHVQIFGHTVLFFFSQLSKVTLPRYNYNECSAFNLWNFLHITSNGQKLFQAHWLTPLVSLSFYFVKNVYVDRPDTHCHLLDLKC